MMKKRIAIFVICIICSSVGSAQATETTMPEIFDARTAAQRIDAENLALDGAEDEWIVKFKNDTGDMVQAMALSPHSKKRISDKKHKLYVVKGRRAVDELRRSADVEYIEKNHLLKTSVTPNDPYYTDSANYQWNLKMVNAPQAWKMTTGSSSVKVAVIDTGMAYSHEDAPVNVMQGWNYLTGSPDTYDSNVHGTAVAGIIGARTNNGIGIAGLNWDVSILPLHCMRYDGYGSTSDIISAVYDAVDTHKVKIINMSMEGREYNQAFAGAVNYAYSQGVIVIASSGNTGDSSVKYPGAYPGVISVASIDATKERSSFSTYNSSVFVTAPGTCVYTLSNPDYQNQNKYAWMFGTSFSAPHVSGLAALVASRNPNITPDEFKELLRNYSTDLGTPGHDDYFGYGLVDFERVLNALPSPVPTETPVSEIPERNIAVNERLAAEHPFGKAGASIVRVNVTGIIDPSSENKVVLVKGVEARYTYYNGVYKFVALVDGGVEAGDVRIETGTPAQLWYGDVNFDGEAASTDMNLLKGALAGNRTSTNNFEYLASDVNGDGELTSTDMNLLKGFLAGNLLTLPVFSK